MMKNKKISFKPTLELRNVEKNIDDWVNSETTNSQDSKEHTKNTKLYRFTLDIPIHLHRRIKKSCAMEGVSMREKLTGVLFDAFPET